MTENGNNGVRFGRLTIAGEAPKRNEQRRVYVVCDCGNKRTVYLCHVVSGRSRSCGCLRAEITSHHNLIHGHSGNGGVGRSSTYRSWAAMWTRCTNQEYSQYDLYGGRGIRVCRRWKNFLNFLRDMGEKPKGRRISIDRIDTNRGYSPSNCRWATPKIQANNRRSNVLLRFRGHSLNATQWAQKLHVSSAAVYWRLKQGWPIGRVLSKSRYRLNRK